MTSTLRKIVFVLGIGFATLFQTAPCDLFTQEFERGFDIGYNGGSLDDVMADFANRYSAGT